jgi:hypothetical protein
MSPGRVTNAVQGKVSDGIAVLYIRQGLEIFNIAEKKDQQNYF